MIENPKNDFEKLFGPYQPGHCFAIETCAALKKINDKADSKLESLNIAEFLLLKNNNNKISMLIIEAKSSVPVNTHAYIQEAQEKFTDSLHLFLSLYLRRHNNDEMPALFRNLENISDIEFTLILAIQKCEKDWLASLQKQLKTALKKTARLWHISLDSIVVVNEAKARALGLIH